MAVVDLVATPVRSVEKRFLPIGEEQAGEGVAQMVVRKKQACIGAKAEIGQYRAAKLNTS